MKTLGLITIGLMFAAPHVWLYFRNRDGGWHPYRASKMRRLRPDKTWEYREAKDSEELLGGNEAERSW